MGAPERCWTAMLTSTPISTMTQSAACHPSRSTDFCTARRRPRSASSARLWATASSQVVWRAFMTSPGSVVTLPDTHRTVCDQREPIPPTCVEWIKRGASLRPRPCMQSRHPQDPSPEQLAALPVHMRRWYHVADFVNRYLKFLSAAWIHTTMRFVLWCTAGNRMKVHGAEHVADLDKKSRVLMVANHRSFFDFYVVAFANVRHTRLAQRAFFPVRAKFFYEGFVGTFINWWMTILAMFPPIVRDSSGRAWNRYALRRLQDELTIPGTWVGIHPEGRRNKEAGPYSFLKPHAGTGRIALSVGDIRVVPLYVVGISNNIVQEGVFNWRRPEERRIDVFFGPPVDLSELRSGIDANSEPSQEESLAAAELCMDAIYDLAEQHRSLYNPDHPAVVPPWRAAADASDES
ncbi:MAG: hypothetical protein CL927_18530 [Deltaproteobacteria bacterium]|nr:hypothetical protein [Deltaproteobacteria bacterium]